MSSAVFGFMIIPKALDTIDGEQSTRLNVAPDAVKIASVGRTALEVTAAADLNPAIVASTAIYCLPVN